MLFNIHCQSFFYLFFKLIFLIWEIEKWITCLDQIPSSLSPDIEILFFASAGKLIFSVLILDRRRKDPLYFALP